MIDEKPAIHAMESGLFHFSLITTTVQAGNPAANRTHAYAPS
jgi:hypothetical protein